MPQQNCHRLRKYLSASARADRRKKRERERPRERVREREREGVGVQCNRISADSESKPGKFARSLSNHGRCRLPSRLRDIQLRLECHIVPIIMHI